MARTAITPVPRSWQEWGWVSRATSPTCPLMHTSHVSTLGQASSRMATIGVVAGFTDDVCGTAGTVK